MITCYCLQYIQNSELEQLKARQESIIKIRFKFNKLKLRVEYLIKTMINTNISITLRKILTEITQNVVTEMSCQIFKYKPCISYLRSTIKFRCFQQSKY